MRVLVTGGHGFLGSHIVRELVGRGHAVAILDLQADRDNLTLAWDEASPPDLPLLRTDITDRSALLGAVRDSGCEVIVHMAGLLGMPSTANPYRAVAVNCFGTANVFDVARELGLRRVVWASTGGVYSGYEGTEVIVEDDTPLRPGNLYSYCKHLNEKVALQYFENYGLDSIGFRPPFTLGLAVSAGQLGRILPGLVIDPVLGRPAKVAYPDDRIAWLDADEVAIAFRIAVEREGVTATRVFNLRAPTEAPMREAMAIVKRILPAAQIEPGEGSRWGEGRQNGPRFGERTRLELGFEPTRTLKEQLERIIRRARLHREDLARLFAGP
jgi:nucleoside-diphosphate-sugar epimerase